MLQRKQRFNWDICSSNLQTVSLCKHLDDAVLQKRGLQEEKRRVSITEVFIPLLFRT